MTTDQLKAIKPGDKVCIWDGKTNTWGTVNRVTEKQIHALGWKFNRDDGLLPLRAYPKMGRIVDVMKTGE